MWMFYMSTNCTTNRDVPFVVWSCMQAMIDKVWFQTSMVISFQYAIFGTHLYVLNLKTTRHIWTFYISNDYSTFRNISFVVRDLTGELQLQTHIAVVLKCNIVCTIISDFFRPQSIFVLRTASENNLWEYIYTHTFIHV